jgi:HNH endonuclease
MFWDYPPLTEEQIFEIAAIDAERSMYRRSEALELFVDLRRRFSDAFVDLDLVVLRPICFSCFGRVTGSGLEFRSDASIVAVLPQDVNGRFRLYDEGSHCLHFFGEGTNPCIEPILCYQCGDRVDAADEEGNDIISVVPIPFGEYFGIEDAGPLKPSGELREETYALYGKQCLTCGATKEITIDHVVAKSKGGFATPTNLQPLCRECNERKAGRPAKTLMLAFDFLLRPAPSDSYEGLIW